MKKKNINITGQEIRDWRKENGISQKQMAELIGIKSPSLCQFEKGKNSLSNEVLGKIKSIMGDGKALLTGQKKAAEDDSNQIISDDEAGINEDNGYTEGEIAMIHRSDIEYLGEKEYDGNSLDSEMEDISSDPEEDDRDKRIKEFSGDDEFNPESMMFDPMSFDVNRKQFAAIKQSAINMASQSKESLRCLVNFYYQYQGQRIANDDRIKKISKGMNQNGDKDSMLALQYLADINREMEHQLKLMLGAYSVTTKVGRWLNDIVGIGPCISAGLLAYFEVTEKMKTAQNFYNYSGLNDNNIPWLSKDDVKKVMGKADEIIKERVEERKAAYATFQNPKYTRIMKKLATTSMDQSYQVLVHGYSNATISDGIRAILEESSITESLRDEFIKDLIEDCGKYEYGPRTWYNTIVYEFNAKEPSPEYLITIAILTHRTYKNIFNGAIDKTKSGNGRRTYDRLSKFLNMPPYLKELKVLCFKIEDSFAKQISRGSLYGKLYKQRKEYELAKNERGDYKEQAYELAKKTTKKDLKKFYLEEGKLTNKHIDRRARRWACKIFISHLFDAMYIDKFGKTPDLPAVFDMGGHLDFIAPEVPYAKYWPNYEDTRNVANVSLDYTPDYTYSFNIKNFKDWATLMDETNPKKMGDADNSDDMDDLEEPILATLG